MPRPPAARVLRAFVLSAVVLLAAGACTSGLTGRSSKAASSPVTTPPGAPGSGLTAAEAQAALLTEADLGAPWAPTAGAATWRDGVLKAQTDAPDCLRLLDVLYTDEPLGATTGPHAVAAFDDGADQAQLRYQVLALRPADVDRALAWLRTLPRTCARFTATTTRDGEQDVQVFELPLPDVGDARQGLRIVFNGESADGQATTLTLDVATVRVGDGALTLTDGAAGSVPADFAGQAVQLGAQRLTDVQRQAHAQA